jgi:hypothetical protein
LCDCVKREIVPSEKMRKSEKEIERKKEKERRKERRKNQFI